MPFNRRAAGANPHPGSMLTRTEGPVVFKLQVAALSDTAALDSMVAAINPASLAGAESDAELDAADSSECETQRVHALSRVLMQLAGGSDCVISVRLDPRVAVGAIEVNAVQQHNLRVASGNQYKFRLFEPPLDEPFDLIDMDGEVRAWSSDGPPITVDAVALTQQFAKQCFGIVLSVGQLVAVSVGGEKLVVRVALTNNLDEEDREEAIGYHCYRGVLTPSTTVYLKLFDAMDKDPGMQSSTEVECTLAEDGTCRGQDPDTSTVHHGSDGSSRGLPTRVGGAGRLRLVNACNRAARPPQTNLVHVFTSDGEWFPVKKKLLRSCISLTKSVRDTAATAPTVHVDVPTLVFDRVLLFLEAEALGRDRPPFPLLHLNDLLQAAQHLGASSLELHCKTLLGEAVNQLRIFSFAEVQQQNAAGQCWLILDGMILDVTRWLPEHPGGSTIIPSQALNLDCARFFEIYHASRESFMYLQEFYIGELDPLDRPLVPTQESTPDFLQQLREYSTFRMQLQLHVFKSF